MKRTIIVLLMALALFIVPMSVQGAAAAGKQYKLVF